MIVNDAPLSSALPRISSTLITTAIFTNFAPRIAATDSLQGILADSRIRYYPPPSQEGINENTKGVFTINTKDDKIIMLSIIGVMFLTAALNLGLFLAAFFYLLFPEDTEEKDEKK
ncbi:unnamed protein product [Onchocerca ochengi]|uniref:Uncharacterized protein n=1 Tax=Onchocerca ochengi TaxID=42157 RepID=A0A182ERK6_ONCOC|nr:unnamed protein product [Onchocerca ochengi]